MKGQLFSLTGKKWLGATCPWECIPRQIGSSWRAKLSEIEKTLEKKGKKKIKVHGEGSCQQVPGANGAFQWVYHLQDASQGSDALWVRYPQRPWLKGPLQRGRWTQSFRWAQSSAALKRRRQLRRLGHLGWCALGILTQAETLGLTPDTMDRQCISTGLRKLEQLGKGKFGQLWLDCCPSDLARDKEWEPRAAL